MKSHKLKEADSFRVFDDSQDEEETKAKVSISVEVQTNFTCNDACINTNLTLRPEESPDAERLFYMKAAEHSEARIEEIRKWNEEGLERIAANKREIQTLRKEYEELFMSLSNKLEDSPAPHDVAS